MYLAIFHYYTKLVAKRVELVQLMHKFVPWNGIGIFHNEHTRSTPLDPKLMFYCVSYHLGAFWTVSLPYETRCKTGRTSAKVRATKSSRIVFATNAPNPPYWTFKLMFWCILYRFGAFTTIWLPCESRGETFWTSAKVCATMSRQNFAQQTHPIHPIGP